MAATARLDVRLSLRDKKRIVCAACRRGVPVSAFVREIVLREAASVIAAAHASAHAGSLSERLRGRATARLTTDDIMLLTRGKWELDVFPPAVHLR